MTQLHLQSIARDVQHRLLASAEWPPARALVDAWFALVTWHEAGEHVYRLRTRTPPIDPELILATAPVARAGVLYVARRDWWMLLARVESGRCYPVARDDARPPLASRDPLLVYLTEVDVGSESGYFNLREQPTPRALRLRAGTVSQELVERRMEREEVGTAAVRVAQCLPWFFASKKI